MNILHVNVVNKIATYLQRDGEIVCGNSDYQIQFTFDSEWDAHARKTARFIWNGKHLDVGFTGNVCDVPKLQNTTELKVGVYAGDLSTTTAAVIGCRQSVLCGGEEAYNEDAILMPDAVHVVGSAGDSDKDIMSQKSVTEHLCDVADSSNFDTHMKEKLIRCAYVYGDYQESPLRVSTDGTFYLPFDAYVEIASGYRVSILHYNSSTPSSENCTNKDTSVWIDCPIVAIPKNVYSTFTVAKTDNSEITIEEAKNAVKFRNSVYIDKMLTVGQADSNVLDSFLKSWFIQSGVNTDGDLVPIATRVCLGVALKFPNKVFIDVPNGYRVTIHTYSGSEIKLSNHIIGLNWNTDSVVVIDSKDYVTFAVSKVDGSNITVEEAQREFKFRVPLDEKIEDYHYTGEAINFDKHSFKVKEILSAPYTIHQGVQGFDIHNGIIAQFESDNMLRLIELKTGETIAEYYCAGTHGSTLVFSETYFESGDEFPLLYVCGGNDPTVYVHRINRAGTSLIARIKYTESVVGYWNTACFDFENKKMYLMGYTENSYSNNTSGKNLMKLTTWDMSKITNNADGTISYALESTFTFPYMYCLQSLAFHDGKIFALISVGGIENTEILVIDPANANVVANFKDFPYAMSIGEAEGVSFADVGDSSQMIVSVKGGDKFTYYGLTFAQTSSSERDVVELKQGHEALVDEVENTNERITDTNERIDKTEKRLTNIEQGVMADSFEVDDSVAYVKDVPSNALPYAAISKIGGMTRKCTNLIPYPYADTTKTVNGITFTDNGDGSITMNGTTTGYTTFQLSTSVNLEHGKTYRMSENLAIAYRKSGATEQSYTTGTIVWDNSYTVIKVFVQIGSGVTVNETIYPMLNEGETALPYEPYFEGLRSAPTEKVESVWANLFDKSKVQNATETDTGFSFTWIGEESAPNKIGTLKNLAPQLKVGDYVTFYANVTNASIDYGNGFFYLSGSKTNWRGGNFLTITQADLDGILYAYGKKDMLCEYSDLRITKIANAPYTPYREPIPLPIPAEVRPAHGINNEVYDYLDFGEQESVVRVGVVDMGTLDWYREPDAQRFYADIPTMAVAGARSLDVLSDKFDADADVVPGDNWKGFCYQKVVLVYSAEYTDAESFKAAVSGSALYYKLAEPIVTDISDILPADNLIGVEGGGTITMVNEHEYAVPSEIIYQVKGVSV